MLLDAGYESVSAYSSDRARSMLPLMALPQTLLATAFRFMALTSLAKSLELESFSAFFGATARTDLCGKIVFRHSIALFLRIVSFVTPEQTVKAFSRARLAALRYETPSVTYASVSVKSLSTHMSDWHTMSFKSLATVVVISRTLELPKLRALKLPRLFVDSTDALAPSSAPNSL